MDCSNVQNGNSLNFQALKGIKVGKNFKQKYPSEVKDLLNSLENSDAFNSLRYNYDVSIELDKKNLFGILKKYVLKFNILGADKGFEKDQYYVRYGLKQDQYYARHRNRFSNFDQHMDAVKTFLENKKISLKESFYQFGSKHCKSLERYFEPPTVRGYGWHPAHEGVGKDDLGACSAGYDYTKESGRCIKLALEKFDDKIKKLVKKNTIKNRLKIQKNERKIALEKQKKLALEKEKQRLAEIPSTIREVDEQITKMLDNTN